MLKATEIKELHTNIFNNYPDVVSIEELQDMLHIGRSTAYKLIKENTIKSIKVGKQYRIPKNNIINYLFAE